MRIFTFSLLAFLLYSCSNSKEEQMLYDYQQENVKSMNFDLKDLDYDVQEIEKVGTVTASDSMNHIKQELAGYWTDNPEQELVDTLTFQHVMNVLDSNIALQDTLWRIHHESVLTAIKLNDISYKIESEAKKNEAINEMKGYSKTLSAVEALEKRYNDYEIEPDAILTEKYRAKYSYNNPMLSNARQTFEKYFYTNKEQTKFIKQESIDK